MSSPEAVFAPSDVVRYSTGHARHRPPRVAKRPRRFAKSPRVQIPSAFIIHKSPHLRWELLYVAGSANFEDKAKTKSKPNEVGSIWKGGAREQKNKLRAQRSGSQFKRKKELT